MIVRHAEYKDMKQLGHIMAVSFRTAFSDFVTKQTLDACAQEDNCAANSALDFATDAALRSAIRELKDKTVFIVSQRASSVMHADKIIVLEDGTCVDIATHDELIERSPVYREIYESQFKKEGER